MILKADKIAARLDAIDKDADPFVVNPLPDLDDLRRSGAASLDLRLGCWFLVLRHTRVGLFNVYDAQTEAPSESKLTKMHYVPFGDEFILHPKSFVLGVTLEWLRFPGNLAGSVVGRSSWGRHGLIIATATGVHPGFAGCLTLELTNVGEIPITIKPGTTICQLCLYEVTTDDQEQVDKSVFVGRRRPVLESIKLDEVAKRLARRRRRSVRT